MKNQPELVKKDPFLKDFSEKIKWRMHRLQRTLDEITEEVGDFKNFSLADTYFGLHQTEKGWIFREWAPNASHLYLTGEFSNWNDVTTASLSRLNAHGVWEIKLPSDFFRHGDLFRLVVHWPGGYGHRLPAFAHRVVQDEHTKIFNAQVWNPPKPYQWKQPTFKRNSNVPLIYEAHIGMAQEEGKVGTYNEFKEFVLPRIAHAGYNTIQLMAIQEHPYYGSFGYQVANFFAVSSRFGSPDDFKELIDAAHNLGLSVIMDIVHSHAVRNEVESLGRFDGTEYQYFHEGDRGYHVAWDSRCFDYGKKEVLNFLLSNCRYWLDEFHIDGFRFDGVTSMLYHHHGLERSFTTYAEYFNDCVDEDALLYLALANTLIHRLRPDALTIAEDMSGMPGIARPCEGRRDWF